MYLILNYYKKTHTNNVYKPMFLCGFIKIITLQPHKHNTASANTKGLRDKFTKPQYTTNTTPCM